MNSRLRLLPAEGEKLSTEEIARIHVQSPDITAAFQRSTLLVGTRGVGKTFLLRHRKQGTHRGAIYVNLVIALQSLTKGAGIGGRAFDLPEEARQQVRAKTSALFVLAVLNELNGEPRLKRSTPDASQLIHYLIPRPVHERLADDSIQALRREINRSRLSEWSEVGDSSADLVDAISHIASTIDDTLTIFIDRAEDAPSPSLEVLLPLLDQSIPALVVIAARPGISSILPRQPDPTFRPGDHFDIVHLGSNPYSSTWQDFAHEAVVKTLQQRGVTSSSQVRTEWARRLGRDSLRLAIEFAQIDVATKGRGLLNDRRDHLAAKRHHHLTTTSAELKPAIPNFSAFVEETRSASAFAQIAPDELPVEIRFTDLNDHLPLLGFQSEPAKLLLSCLRANALFLPRDRPWHPFELPTRFELPPIFVWDGEDETWLQ